MKLVARVEMQKELALFPWAATEVLEGQISCRGFPLRSWGLNPKPDFPAQSTRAGKMCPYDICCEKPQSFCPSGRDRVCWRHWYSLKVPAHKISFTATYPELQQREGRVN